MSVGINLYSSYKLLIFILYNLVNNDINLLCETDKSLTKLKFSDERFCGRLSCNRHQDT